MAGYSRQSSAQIVDGSTVYASHFNNEYNQIEAAFSAATGHKHDGTAAEGPQLTPAAMSGLSSNGLAVRSSGAAWVARTLSPPASGMTITNGDGVAGNPSFAFANDLAAVEGLTGTGLAVRTAADTWTNRSVTGTANEITVTNGDGVSGAPTVSLPNALTFTGKTITGGTLSGVSYSTVTGISAAGTTQGTATAITGDINIVSTVASGTGVVLPTPIAGRSVVIFNRGANTLNVYPASGGTIDGLSANAATTVATNTSLTLDASTSTQWYSISSGGSSSNTTDVFSGNGSTTAFTLSGTPATANTIWVFISGVYQQKSTYTWNGTTGITFSVAPPTGTSNVEIVWGSASSTVGVAANSVTQASFAVTPNTANGVIYGDSSAFVPLANLPTGTTANKIVKLDGNANATVNNLLEGYATTVTAAGTTTLTVSSPYYQTFTGTTTQTITLPVASTLVQGQSWQFTNQSTGNITVQSSGANSVVVIPPSQSATVTCVLTSGTTAASWQTDRVVGTSANNLVALTSAAKLPAVDGSLLTGITSGMTLIASSINISGASSVDFTTGIDATYDEYLFAFNLLPTNNNVQLNVWASTNSGSTWDTTVGNYDFADTYSDQTNVTNGAFEGATSNSSGFLLPNGMPNTASEGGIVGEIRLFKPSSSTKRKLCSVQITSVSTTPNFYNRTGGTRYKSTTAVNAVRFIMSAGTIASGDIQLYGIKRS